MNKLRLAGLAMAIATLTMVSCDQTNQSVEPRSPQVELTLTNLPILAESEAFYEAWVTFFNFSKNADLTSPAHGEGFVSIGRFRIIDSSMIPYGLDGERALFSLPPDRNPQLLDDMIITVQTGIHDEEPGSLIIGGEFHGDEGMAVAELSMAYEDALGSDFAKSEARYTITCPSSPPDSNSGIWFCELQGAGFVPGLTHLPTFTEGWRYEGWVVKIPNDGSFTSPYFSSGTFLNADSSDSDGAGVSKGPGQGVNYPGQDFVIPVEGLGTRPNLRTPAFVFMISIEPFPDNSANPFLTLFSSPPGVHPALQRQSMPMVNVMAGALPRGSALIAR